MTESSLPPPPASLRFSPTAWAKLLFLRDYGDTEVGGFAISNCDDLLLVEDVQLVEQVCTWAHVAFDDDSVADFFDRQVDEEREPEQFGRIWVHTHPGNCSRPSATDEVTFDSAFGRSDWAIMFILARGGSTYARLRFNVGPGAEIEIPVCIDYSQPFGGCDPDEWEQEYLSNVSIRVPRPVNSSNSRKAGQLPSEQELLDEWYEDWIEYTEESEDMKGYALEHYK